MKTTQWRTGLLGLAVLLILLHCYQFRGFVVDDAAISYSYARDLAQGHGLILTPWSERVEGYTNFLWVALLAGAIRFGFDVFVAARGLGALLAALALWGTAELLAALRGRRSPVDAAPALLCAALTSISYWAMSGLENPLYMALIMWCAVRLLVEQADSGRWPLSAVLAAGLPLTRPDGILLLGVAVAFRILSRRRGLLSFLVLACAPVVVHGLWRYFYYALPLPHTFYAKVHEPFRLRDLVNFHTHGWRYVLGNLYRYQLGPLLVAAALALLRRHCLKARLLIAGLFVAVLFFPIYAGGDWMSEGRFLVAAWPLLAVLAVDGTERLVELGQRFIARPVMARGLLLLLLCLVAALPVFTALKTTAARRDHYPVPFAVVAERGQAYRNVAHTLHITKPSALDGDLGGTSYVAGMPIIDLGALADVTIARWFNRDPAVMREYLFGERHPTFLRLFGFWLDHGFQLYPEFERDYVSLLPIAGQSGLYLSRSVLTRQGVDTRRPLARFDSLGLDLLGAAVQAADVTLWLLVRRDGAGPLLLRDGAHTHNVVPGEDLVGSFPLRAGEVLCVHIQRQEPGELTACGGDTCVPLPLGDSGSRPVPLPLPTPETLAHARALGELELALAITGRLNQDPKELAQKLYQRGLRAEAAGDFERAFNDYTVALAALPSLSFARQRIEALRQKLRAAYHDRPAQRLEQETSAFQLQPDEAHLARLTVAALAAGRPESAVLAHLATGLLPRESTSRLDLLEALVAVGLPERGAALLPTTPPQDHAEAERVQKLARWVGRQDLVRAAANVLTGAPVTISPGLVLVSAWAGLRPSGQVELSLALRRTTANPADTLAVNHLTIPFRRPPTRWETDEVYVEHVSLVLPPGSSTVSVGSATLTVEVSSFTQDFETGRLDGWVNSGDAFTSMPRAYAKHFPGLFMSGVVGFRGHFLVDTRGDGTGGPSALDSPPLLPEVSEVCFLLGGSGDISRTGVRLVAEDNSGPSATGQWDLRLRDACLVPAGPRSHIQIFQAGGLPRYLLVDDIECFAAGRPVPCAGGVRVQLPQ